MVSPEEQEGGEREDSCLSRNILLIGLGLGLLLRLIAVIYGDIGVYVDGASRIAIAIRWAEHPSWQGLSGDWPPLHWYFLGSLIRLWNEPVALAKAINFICGVGGLYVFRSAIRPFFSEITANTSLLILAIYWTNIWLASSYWVEIPYLLFVFLAVNHAAKTRSSLNWSTAFLSGSFLSFAMLLRNEGLLLFLLFLVWYILNVKDRISILSFAAVPVCVFAWYLIEPSLYGHSYLDYFSYVKQSKEVENLTQGITLKDCLIQWAMMLAASPTVFVVAPGLYGLWRFRHQARHDLFAWMFVSQVVFYLTLTLTSAWRPQLRYLMLYFVNLIPYTALVLLQTFRRFSPRYALPLLLVLTIIIQAVAWWMGRNNRLPMGWLPLQVRTSSQKALDQWIEEIKLSGQKGLKISSIVPGPLRERWSLDHSFVVNRIPPGTLELEEIHIQVDREILNGHLPEKTQTADLILIDPHSVFYSAVLNALAQRKTGMSIRQIHPHITVMLLSERALANTQFLFN